MCADVAQTTPAPQTLGCPHLDTVRLGVSSGRSQVCRIKTLHRNALIDHKGIFRIITNFKLSRKKLNEGVDVGFRSEGERMAATLEKNLAKFKEASRRRWGEM